MVKGVPKSCFETCFLNIFKWHEEKWGLKFILGTGKQVFYYCDCVILQLRKAEVLPGFSTKKESPESHPGPCPQILDRGHRSRSLKVVTITWLSKRRGVMMVDGHHSIFIGIVYNYIYHVYDVWNPSDMNDHKLHKSFQLAIRFQNQFGSVHIVTSFDGKWRNGSLEKVFRVFPLSKRKTPQLANRTLFQVQANICSHRP